MNVQCFICHDPIRVPVRFTCFPCDTKPGMPSCNSITRVCLECAREYLQLNKKRDERVGTRKCLTCPATASCAYLSSSNSYEKDFFIMSMDARRDYPCFHDKCGFKGTQNELNNHIHDECPERTILCKLCKSFYIAREEDGHAATCPERFCCTQCHEYIPRYDAKNHYQEKHNMQKCRYCHELVSSSGFNQHYETCPERPRDCPSCHRPIPRCQLYTHMVEHIDSIHRHIAYNNTTNTNLFNRISILLAECKKYV